MAKVLHAADFHLDSAFRSLPEEQARLRRQESRELPGQLVDWANDHGAQLMLLAGDLFDSDRLFSQTAQMLAQALARFQGTVVIAPGNHDWLSAASPYRQPIWPENVRIFLGRGMERLTLPELGCTVYGAAFTAPEEIASTGLDYLALGHVHAPSAMNRAGSTVWAYPGCPQGRGFDETGDRGFLFGDVEPGRVDMQFVPFARRRYEVLTVDVSQGDALEAIRRRLPPDTSRDIYRIRLTGETAEPLTLPALEQALSGGFFQLELADDTRLRRDLWDRCGDDTLRGLFLRRLRREYDAADPRRQKEIEQAVRFGLAAMDNKEL